MCAWASLSLILSLYLSVSQSSIFLFLCLVVSLSLCLAVSRNLAVSLSRCLAVSLSHCLAVSLSHCLAVSLSSWRGSLFLPPHCFLAVSLSRSLILSRSRAPSSFARSLSMPGHTLLYSSSSLSSSVFMVLAFSFSSCSCTLCVYVSKWIPHATQIHEENIDEFRPGGRLPTGSRRLWHYSLHFAGFQDDRAALHCLV